MLLPLADFDPTESAVPWRVLTDAGHTVHFATEDGGVAHCDPKTLTGDGLRPWGLVLRAKAGDRELYGAMAQDQAFLNPVAWADINPRDFGALILPGGHAPGMKPYLESDEVSRIIVDFFMREDPVAAVCHGVLAVARAKWQETQLSVLFGRQTTALNNLQETSAVIMTTPFLGNHYKTYPISVQDEVTGLLEKAEHFHSGPVLPRFGTAANPTVGFTLRDRNYLSARWPGDVHRWAHEFSAMLSEDRA